MKESTARVGWMLAAPLLLVNSAAIWGQAGWAHDHITTAGWDETVRWVVAILFAVAVESVGVFLAGMAHAALMADQSAATLRLGSYLVGLLVGLLNYWHFAGPGLQPTAQAVAFGALSSISPWLWAVYSRYRNRDRLAELGQVDKRGVKLSTSRKFWHPVKSIRVLRFASWEGIVEPDEAVRAWTVATLPPAEEPAPGLSLVPGTSDDDEPPFDPWNYSTRELRLVPKPLGDVPEFLRDAFFGRPAPGEPSDLTHDEGPDGPRSDEELLARFGDALRLMRRTGKLNRYQVEKTTGANRRQVGRILDQIMSESDQNDQADALVSGTKEQT